MDKEVHLEFMRRKYIELSRQYLNELQAGKSTEALRDLSDVIKMLIKEIEELEKEGK